MPRRGLISVRLSLPAWLLLFSKPMVLPLRKKPDAILRACISIAARKDISWSNFYRGQETSTSSLSRVGNSRPLFSSLFLTALYYHAAALFRFHYHIGARPARNLLWLLKLWNFTSFSNYWNNSCFWTYLFACYSDQNVCGSAPLWESPSWFYLGCNYIHLL